MPGRPTAWSRRVAVRLERAGIVAAMVLASVNLWTGAPLLGLWVGSRLAGEGGISMAAVAAVGVTFFVAALACVQLLGVLNARLDRLSGARRVRVVRQQLPWLRSMRGERVHAPRTGMPALSPLDYALVISVVVCMVAFEVWFFFFSSSPIDQRSGR